MSLFDNLETDIIPYNSLYEILFKMDKPSEYLNNDIKERLFKFSMEGLKVNEKNKMLLENTINIKNLILNIFKFRVISGNGYLGKNPSFKESCLELGIEAQNEKLKNTILDCLATKKKSTKRTLGEREILFIILITKSIGIQNNWITLLKKQKLQLLLTLTKAIKLEKK